MRSSFSRTAIATALVGVVVAGGSAYAPAADPVDQLRQDLDAILDASSLTDGQASVLVRDADGTELYARGPNERGMPASNAKLFTSTAALEVLGPDHRFPTTVLAKGKQRGGTLVGDLYLRGQGDPTLLARDLDELAGKVAAEGTTYVLGNLVTDDTWYDNTRLGASWASDNEGYYYNAQISALTLAPDEDYDAGTVIVEIRPAARAGLPADVKVVPETSYVKIVNQATTSGSGSVNTSVERTHGTNTIVVSGTIPVGASVDQNWATVWEPTGYAADVFRKALTAYGVKVAGKTVSAATPADARLVASHESMTLAQMLVPFMKLSNNMHAEHLVKEMGRKTAGVGSWSAGLNAAFTALSSMGVERNRMRFVDGSGLARMDVVSSQQVINLLTSARAKPWFTTWYDSLPIACKSNRFEGGTLRSRMCNTPAAGNVHAKTGSLTGATALSGYVTDADGKQLMFSIIHNNYLPSVNPKTAEDQIAIRLSKFTRTATAGTSQLAPLRKTDYGPSDVECSWVKAC